MLSRAASVPIIALFTATLWFPSSPSFAEALEVRVNNFPATQQIKGTVSLDGTTKAIKREGILVSPTSRDDITDLVHAGTVATDGFTSVVVSLQGEVKSTSFSAGTIGVILLPDEEPIIRALKDTRQFEFQIETACNLKSGDSDYFSSPQNEQRIAFPRYRIYLYNTLNKAAETNVYLYLRK